MAFVNPWEIQTKELLNRVEKEIKDTQIDMEKRITKLYEEAEALQKALQIYRERMGISQDLQTSLSPNDMRGKSLREILTLVASRNNGLLIAKQAIKLMKDAKLFSNPKHADSIVYSILGRSPKHFVKVGPGVYNLRRTERTKRKTRGGSGLKQKIKELKEMNPQMTKTQVANYLMQQGFDFQGRRPGNAINMAWVSLGYHKEEKQPKMQLLNVGEVLMRNELPNVDR
ncbi:MAG: hypothetical protein WBH01_08785 [Dehalococcoidia bacterium]